MRLLPLINEHSRFRRTIRTTESARFSLPILASTRTVAASAPHMHLLGAQNGVDASPWRQSSCLININDWDFNWQGLYRYKDADCQSRRRTRLDSKRATTTRGQHAQSE